jgi:NADPH-dependent 2,4-dienoyl-CoA reductase/sulfur reductase-like enzyme/rhodanese-related sulfurtransferase
MDEQAEIVLFERSGDVSFANCGLPYYLGKVIPDRKQLLVATPQRFREMFRIEVRTRHAVEAIDRANKTIRVKNLLTGEDSVESYDFLVLAPGAAPVRPPLPGIDLPSIFTLRNLDDVDRLAEKINTVGQLREGEAPAEPSGISGLNTTSAARQEPRPPEMAKAVLGGRAVVVGGGFIGLEMVENLRRRGMNVTLLEKLGQIMPPADAEMTSPLVEKLHHQGVDLHLNCGVTGFEPGENETVIVNTENGERFTADMVILAIGVKPDVRLAKDSGLEIGTLGGIRVDDRMRTKDPAIFAVGDAVEVIDFITGRPTLIPLAGPANRQGRLAADAICGRDVHYRGSQGTSIVGLFDQCLAMTGASEKTLRRVGMPFEKTYTHSLNHAGYYPGAERISMKILFDPRSGRLLGAQAVGKAGVDKRIDVLAMAIQREATVFDLEETELCYAPQFGSAKDPVNIAGFVAGNILRGDVVLGNWSDWKALAAKGTPPVTLDVRPASAVAASAIPGTIRIPLAELRSRLDELPRDKEIWVHCVVGQTSYNAVRMLVQNGFKVRNLSGGITSFKMEG